jgi:hypothetical protein
MKSLAPTTDVKKMNHVSSMKYFVIHYPKKPTRKQLLIRQFEKYGIDLDDVTWIEGLNKDDHFVKWIKHRTESPMPLGQVSSSVKQYTIMQKIVDENIPEAIIFEDDVIIHPEFIDVDPRIECGFLRLGIGVGILEHECPKASPTVTYTVHNPGGCEAFWVSNDFAKSFMSQANFDYSIDMTQMGHLHHVLGHSMFCRYVCHQTSLGNSSDSSTGACPGNWQEYCRNYLKYKTYNFPMLVHEYVTTHVMMQPMKGHGLANVLIHLCDFFVNNPGGVVHESICDYEMGRWLDFKFPVTSQVCTRTYTPRISINNYTIQHVHSVIRQLIQPSAELEKLLTDNSKLIKGVQAGIHIRRGSSAPDSRKTVENDGDVYANEKAIEQFQRVAVGDVFLASDSPETKNLFPHARTLDTTIAVVHGHCPDLPTKDRRNVFVDFFLLSRCPKVYVTGGNFPEMPGLSTFGYMAAIYGGVPFEIISNSS